MRVCEVAETRAIWRGLEAWGREVPERALGDAALWIGPDQIVCLVAPTTLPDALQTGDDLLAGLPIGRLDDGEFVLGLQGALLVAPHAKRGIVRVHDKGAQMWLYGKAILGASVQDWSYGLKRGDACIVCNARREALGIGIIVGSFKGSGEVVRPLDELGTYLRDQD